VTPMRILLTTDTIGGVWTYAIELACALRDSNVDIALATMGAPLSADQRRQVKSLDHVTVFESQYKLEWMDNPWDDVEAAGRWLLNIEQKFCPDIVHLNGYAHGALSWNAPVLIAAHSCVASWWQAVKGHPAPREWDRYRAEVRSGLRSADLVVAPSSAMLAAAQAHHGPLSRSRVIYNGRDASLFHSTWKEPFFLSAGRLWDQAKNIAALARIAPRSPWPVYVAGDGADTQAPNLRCLGKLDAPSLATWYARASVYVLPAKYEPFGLSALEAALSGCALILGDIPSLREIWSDAAVFVPPDNGEALLDAMMRLAGDANLRDRLAARAAMRAGRYTPDAMAAEYLAAYRELSGAISTQIDTAVSLDVPA
jgi:glycogen synthase